MGSRLGGFPLSAFASELLPRVQHNLGDPGAFGRLAQEIVVAALKRLYPGLHDNRGAGTPDCQYNDGEVAWAWEIKYTNGEAVHLGSRDIDGLQLGSASASSRSRLVVLDIAFPARLWVLDASSFREGPLLPDAHAHARQYDEAARLGEVVEALLRRADIDLVASEQEAKALVQEIADSLEAEPEVR